MKLFSEILTIYRFFKKTPFNKRRIVFYAEHSGYYSYFEGLINELTNHYNETISYVTSDPSDPILKTENPRIKPFLINGFLIFFMKIIDAKIFVMTLTDLNQFHLKRSQNPVNYVYVFHALVSTHMMYRRGSFDYYDTIFCVGPHHIQEIRRYEELTGLKKKKLVEAGYYRLERIYNAYKKQEFLPVIKSKKTVLIAPSWGEKNILESCGEKLITILLKNNYNVIVRPHPEIIKRSPKLISKLESRFNNNSMFILEKSVASDESLLKADVMISDYSGVAFEYAFGTERPVLFIDVPPKIKNQQFEELGIEPLELKLRPEIGTIVSPDDLHLIPTTLEELILRKNDFKNKIIELRNKNIFAFGMSSDIGAKYILELLNV